MISTILSLLSDWDLPLNRGNSGSALQLIFVRCAAYSWHTHVATHELLLLWKVFVGKGIQEHCLNSRFMVLQVEGLVACNLDIKGKDPFVEVLVLFILL